MTLGEFRKYTEFLPDDVELLLGYGESSIKINTFSTNGTNLILCKNVYYSDDKMQIYKTILKIAANYENLKKRKSSE